MNVLLRKKIFHSILSIFLIIFFPVQKITADYPTPVTEVKAIVETLKVSPPIVVDESI